LTAPRHKIWVKSGLAAVLCLPSVPAQQDG
jgi:hypothetical protein